MKMDKTTRELAKREIDESLRLSTFCMRRIGVTFNKPKSTSAYLGQKLMFVLSVFAICYHISGDIIFICVTFSNSPRIEEVVPLFHTFGYGSLSIAKMFVLLYKKNVFGKLLEELSGIWPMPPLDTDSQGIKEKSLNALKIAHQWYFAVSLSGIWFYNMTPIFLYFYRSWQGQDAQIGFIWSSWYPFDEHRPVAHVAVYIFEIFAGQTSVWIMLSTDLLFSGMASHIGLLLRILQRRLESFATTEKTDDEHYQDIIQNIKLHQRLINYCNDLEEAFSLVNLINYVLSSVNICCVLFVIVLLEPLMAMSNKLFLMSTLIQIGKLCWYADDIFHANADVASAAYNSGWYHTSPRCRRTLLFLIQRSQKPIAFTAMNFTIISLVAYSAILTRSYSYFALLYTMYNDN